MTKLTYMQTHNTNTQTGIAMSILLKPKITVLKEAAIVKSYSLKLTSPCITTKA